MQGTTATPTGSEILGAFPGSPTAGPGCLRRRPITPSFPICCSSLSLDNPANSPISQGSCRDISELPLSATVPTVTFLKDHAPDGGGTGSRGRLAARDVAEGLDGPARRGRFSPPSAGGLPAQQGKGLADDFLGQEALEVGGQGRRHGQTAQGLGQGPDLGLRVFRQLGRGFPPPELQARPPPAQLEADMARS